MRVRVPSRRVWDAVTTRVRALTDFMTRLDKAGWLRPELPAAKDVAFIFDSRRIRDSFHLAGKSPKRNSARRAGLPKS